MNEKVGKAHIGAEGAAGSARMMPGGAEVEAKALDAQAEFYDRKGDKVRAQDCRDRAAELRARA